MNNSINTILNLIRADNFITVNKSLIKNIGLLPAAMYVELCSKYNYYQSKGQLKDGYFYCTIESFKDDVGLSREEQDTAFKKLVSFGLIDKKVAKLKGDEAPKRYIKIIDDMNLILSYFKEKEEKQPESINNSGFVAFTQNEMCKSHNSSCGIYTTSNINNNTKDNIKLVSQSEEKDRQTDTIQSIIEQSELNCFPDDKRKLVEESIRTVFFKPEIAYTLKVGLNHDQLKDRLSELRINHLDRAFKKYGEHKSTVKNTLTYFTKVLIESIAVADAEEINYEEVSEQ